MSSPGPSDREGSIARVLRPLGHGPLTLQQARRAAQLLGMHWSSIYRLRRRFLADPVASSLRPRKAGPRRGGRRLSARVDRVIDEVLTDWLPRQRHLAHPLLDLVTEVRSRCARTGLQMPSRNTVARRWSAHREALALEHAKLPAASVPPGSLVAARPLEIVQIDHTQADVMVVDECFRRPLGRPWLTLAVDVATRCVVGMYLGMERPGAAAVALVLTRIALPKAPWLARLGVEADWPMHGIPTVLHLDNAAEFKSRALRSGCSQYGVELMYRPVGRPHFGGHIERLNRTLMERLRGLPGATGSSTKGRKARAPENEATLTLRELERWLALEVAQRYHHSPHHGLLGATPASHWDVLTQAVPVRLLGNAPDEPLRYLVQFLPMARRRIQKDGLTLFYIRYWHPIFDAWRRTGREVTVRYHPEDLSRVFVGTSGRDFVEVGYGDARRPPISLAEQRAAVRLLREQGQRSLSEMLVFKAIEEQRRLVSRARGATRRRRQARPSGRDTGVPPAAPLPAAVAPAEPAVDYSKDLAPFEVEQW